MKVVTPVRSRRNLRTFVAALLAYLMLAGQVAPLALAAARPNSAAPTPKAEAKVESGSGESSRAAAAPAPLAPTTAQVTATMTGTITTDADNDTKADPGVDTITYSATVTNNSGGDLSGLQFTDTVDTHTTLVAGSTAAAADDSYHTIGNVNIDVPANQGVLVNDFDPATGNNAGMTVTSYGASTGKEQTSLGSSTATAQGGTVTANSNGSFTYDPKVGFTGTDSFKYAATTSGGNTAIATARITLSGMIWFVKNDATACIDITTGCGRLSHPFSTLAAFQGVNDGGSGPPQHPKANDAIFIYTGNASYLGGTTLLSGQILIGQGASASIETITGYTTPSGSTVLPATGGTPPTIVNASGNDVSLTSGSTGNTIRGVTLGISSTTGFAIAMASGTGFGTLTLNDLAINNSPVGGGALSLDTGTLAATIASVTSTGTVKGVSLTNVAGSLTVNGGTVTVTSASNSAFSVTGGTLSITYGGSISQLGTASLVNISGTHQTGTITFQTGTLSTSTGSGLQLGTANGTYNFNGTATLSGTAGVNIQGLSTGTFNFGTGTSITNTSGDGFTVNTSTPSVTYSGSITKDNIANTSGLLVKILNQASGTITFQTGTLSSTSTSATANGISLSNADGTVNFNGTNTLGGGNAHVFVTNSCGGTFNFSSNTTITSPSSGPAFDVSGTPGSPTVNYAGTITQNSAQRVVNVDTTTGGSVSFTDSSTGVTGGSSSTGININAAVGNVSFAKLTLGTSGSRMVNQAVTITGGSGTFGLGTVGIFTTGAQGIVASSTTGTINTTTGTVDATSQRAVDISGVSSASKATLGMTLTNVLSTSSPTNGITLTNTAGTFHVVGNSGTCTTGTPTCTGGSIQSATAEGVLLNNVAGIQLAFMKIQNSGTDGIASGVVPPATETPGANGFTLDHSIVTDTTGVSGDEGLQLADMSGTVTISNSTINGAPHNGIMLTNRNTNLSAFNLTNSTISNNGVGNLVGNDGLLFVTQGTTNVTAATISGCTFSNILATSLQPQTQDTSTITNFLVTGNTFSHQNMAFDGDVSQASHLTTTIGGPNNTDKNSFTFTTGPNTINLDSATTSTSGATLTAKVQNNDIGTQGTKESGGGGVGIRAAIQGAAHGVLRIDNNRINEIPNGSGIKIFAVTGTGGANVEVINNTMPKPTGTNINPGCNDGVNPCPTNTVDLEVLNGQTMCAIVTGNSAWDPESFTDGAGQSAYYLFADTTTSSHLNLEGNTGLSANQNISNNNSITSSTGPNQIFTFGVTVVAAGTCGSFPSGPVIGSINTPNDAPAGVESAETLTASAAFEGANVSATSAPAQATDTASASAREWSDIPAARAEGAARQVNASYADDSDSPRDGVRFVNTSYEPSGSDALTGSRASRRVKARAAIAAVPVTPCSPGGINNAGTAVCVDIPPIHDGDSIQITFQVKVNNPPNLTQTNPAQVSNFGTVTGSFANSPVNTSTVNTPVDRFHSTTNVSSDQPGGVDNGAQVTFTATVSLAPSASPTPASPTTPTGTVTFKDGGSDISGCVNKSLDLSAQAQCTTVLTFNGSPHQITAVYSGDGNFNPTDANNPANPFAQTVFNCLTTATVNTTADPGDGTCDTLGTGDGCTLREAIASVCNNGTINFDATVFDLNNTHEIHPATVLPDLNKNMTITGPRADVLSVFGNTGNLTAFRVFNVTSGKTVTISGLTMTTGRDDTGGGDLNNAGTLTLQNCAVTFGNSSTNGGGISNSGTLTLNGCTVSNNTAGGNGGGIFNGPSATLTLANSTVSDNTSSTLTPDVGGGGGLFNSATATATLENCTVADNFGGGGIFSGGTTSLINTIVANNFQFGNTPITDVSGTFTSLGHNLIQDDTGAPATFNQTGDQTGVDPKLGALSNNGGPTQTRALQPGSPAIDAGDNCVADSLHCSNASLLQLTTDQRGATFPRKADAADDDTTQTVDIGSFEVYPSVQQITDQTTAEDTEKDITFNVGDNAIGFSSITATSSNTALVLSDNTHLVITGTGGTRTLAIHPVPDANSPANGTTNITVTVAVTNGQTATTTFKLTVTEVNDPPVPTNDTIADIAEDSGTYTIPISSLLANDTNKGAANESGQTLTLTDANNATGGTISSFDATNVYFSPTLNFNGAAGFDYTVTDDGTTNGSSDPKTGTAHVSFNITAVDDPPVNTVPGAQSVNEDTDLVFSSGVGNQISVADVDAGGGDETVTLTASHGKLTLATTANLTSSSGNGTSSVTLTGTLANLNTAMNGLKYRGNLNYNGGDTLQIVTNDNSHTGTGGPLSDTDSVTITVNPVADTPSASGSTTNEDTQTTTGLVITPNAADGAEVTNFKITSIQHGKLFKHDGTTQISSGDFIAVSDAADVGGFGLTFTPDADFNDSIGTASFDVQASLSNTDAGLGGSVVTATISVTAVNDAPSFTKGADQAILINAGAQTVNNWATNIAPGPATATDESGQTLNFIVTNDNNGLFSSQPAVSSTGTLTYTPASNMTGQATVSVSLHDNGGTANGGNNTSDVQTFTITVGQPSLKVLDAKAAEPSSDTSQMLFTVVMSVPLGSQTVTVDYQTADGTATSGTCGSAGADYQAITSGTLTFNPGETMKTVPVTICADGAGGPDETLLLNLLNPSGATIARAQATGTITQSNPAGTFIISELRTSGPGGVGDQFVELYNNTDTELTVQASDSSAGYGVFKMGATCSDLPVLVATIANGTMIPARGHYLLRGSAYAAGALNSYATGDQQLTSDIEADRNVAVFSTADVSNLSTVTRLDAVGFGGNINTAPVTSDAASPLSIKHMRVSVSTSAPPPPTGGGVCDLLREGNTLPAASGSALEYSFFRKECDFHSGCTTPGTPKDTNDNASDFLFADTQGTSTLMGQRLGAPGPENKNSPIRRDSTMSLVLLDSTQSSSAATNRFRDQTANQPPDQTLKAFGTLSLRRRVQNNTGANVTRLRFRIVEVTTFPAPPGTADLRAITSVSASVQNVNDPATCLAANGIATTPCTVTVKGTTLEQPPNQTVGGGFNSTLAEGTVTTGTPLLPGASTEIQFQFGVMQTGGFRVLVIIEALP